MGAICQDLGVPVLDLFPVLAAHDHEVLYIPKEGHFTERAHSVVADSLVAYILENVDRPHHSAVENAPDGPLTYR